MEKLDEEVCKVDTVTIGEIIHKYGNNILQESKKGWDHLKMRRTISSLELLQKYANGCGNRLHTKKRWWRIGKQTPAVFKFIIKR